jgi:hypothetical protein
MRHVPGAFDYYRLRVVKLTGGRARKRGGGGRVVGAMQEHSWYADLGQGPIRVLQARVGQSSGSPGAIQSAPKCTSLSRSRYAGSRSFCHTSARAPAMAAARTFAGPVRLALSHAALLAASRSLRSGQAS